jgi:FkbM family methyltransferase
MPADHELPRYQPRHRLYDRFLPLLCSHLRDGFIVDVGANVGDGVAAILPVCTNKIIAIEGHEKFFAFLATNLARIDPTQSRVTPIQAVVGTGQSGGTLRAAKGTATLSGKGAGAFTSLDALLSGKTDQIALLKVDTDGYDADVILSGLRTIRSSKPLLFWEGPTIESTSFASMYAALEEIGYCRFWVFDNFGNLMLAECGSEQLRNLDSYVLSQYQRSGTRTMHYTDVLASTESTVDIVKQAAHEFRERYINAVPKP